MPDVRSPMSDVKTHPACLLQQVGALLLLVVLSLTPAAFTLAQEAAPEPDPHVALIEQFRAAEDDEAIAAAWRAMHEAMTDAQIKAALAGQPTDDGTLRADLALLAPDLDLMPTGDEGPGDFQWVRLAAHMRREFEAVPHDRQSDEEHEHWHMGHLASTREFWEWASPEDGPNGIAIRHIVALGCVGQHPQMHNDGIPLTQGFWDGGTAISIVRRVLDTESMPRLSGFPPAEVSWADRGLVWLINALVTVEFFESGEGVRHTQAFEDMLHDVVKNQSENAWLGAFSAEPAFWDDEFGPRPMGRHAWNPLDSPVDEENGGQVPQIDWEQWVATGLCLVRVHRDRDWWEADRALIDRIGMPAIVLVPERWHMQGGVSRETKVKAFLFLPGVRPMAFGTFDLPGEDAE